MNPLSLSASILLLTMAQGCRPAPPPPPTPESWRAPLQARGRAAERNQSTAWCGLALRLRRALPDPTDVPDRDGEWLEIRNDAPEAVPLDGWSIDTGSRSTALDGLVIGPGETLCVGGRQVENPLRKLRLRNGSGAVTLIGPCGIRWSSLSWGPPSGRRLKGDEVAVSPRPWDQNKNGPARSPGGAVGGCGQI